MGSYSYNSHKNLIQTDKSGIRALYGLAILILLTLIQNKDWSNSSIVWWSSVAFFVICYFINYDFSLKLDGAYTIWIVGFVLLCFSSVIWAINTALVMESMKSLIVYLMLLILLRASISNMEDINRLLKIFLTSVVVNMIYLVATNDEMFEQQVQGPEETIDRLGTKGDWNANIVGMYAAFAMLVALYFLYKSQTNKSKLFYLGLIALSVFISLITGSRKAFLIVVLCLALFIFLSAKRKRIKALLIIAIIVAFIYYLVMEVPFFYSILGWRIDGFLASLTGEGEVESSVEIRDLYITEAIRVWKDNFILGCGHDCFRKLNTVKANMYSHNNFTELLANLGLVGFVTYYISFMYGIKNILLTKVKDNSKWLFLTLTVVILITDYGNVSYTSLLQHFLIMLMFAYVSLTKNCKKIY